MIENKKESLILSRTFTEEDLLTTPIPIDSKLENLLTKSTEELPEIFFITSYPPRVCGIATYSQDLIKALNNKFGDSYNIKVCALEDGNSTYSYPEEVKYILDTSKPMEYRKLARHINHNSNIQMVVIQHEFGFYHNMAQVFLTFLYELIKPIVLVFHTVIPNPNEQLKLEVKNMVAVAGSVVVMTNNAASVLQAEYNVPQEEIEVIAHGTHLVPHINRELLKKKYGLTGKKVLTTFGLLSSGKSIETTLDSLPEIIKTNPDVVFLLLGKTHPMVLKSEGENYRNMLESKMVSLKLHEHVRFINNYLALPELLEYLQLTDIYLFTSKDPNQAVSGTFSYAMGCACPIISTPIPHAKEVLTEDTGIIFDFQNSQQLAEGVNRLLQNEPLLNNMSSNSLQKIVSTSWENSAIAHTLLFAKISSGKIKTHYSLPEINLSHIKHLTTDIGIIQFSKINQPDISSGFTLDDNARALIAICMHYELTSDPDDLILMNTYIQFIKYCQQPEGNFYNYVDKDRVFSEQNTINLEDANGRAVWALGYVISKMEILPKEIISEAFLMIQNVMGTLENVHSTRAMAFIIKGLYYYHSEFETKDNIRLIKIFANRLVEMYKHESDKDWKWFEGYLTYANSVIPEAMVCAWMLTNDFNYKDIARTSFGFLLSSTFNHNRIEVVSNKSWYQKGKETSRYGEQPIDVAYTVMTLSMFYDVFDDREYLNKLYNAFNWFLGNNQIHQIIYNPVTGGCYDGLEETHVNLNQGAESTVNYLMARLTIEKYKTKINDLAQN